MKVHSKGIYFEEDACGVSASAHVSGKEVSLRHYEASHSTGAFSVLSFSSEGEYVELYLSPHQINQLRKLLSE